MALKILLVEDNQDICEVTSLLLYKLGYSITTAANGQEGLELFKKRQFDLIITDIYMPVMDGNRFIAELTEFSDLPPIIALSYNTFDIKLNPVISIMATKPLTSERLGQIVYMALSMRKNAPLKGNSGTYLVS